MYCGGALIKNHGPCSGRGWTRSRWSLSCSPAAAPTQVTTVSRSDSLKTLASRSHGSWLELQTAHQRRIFIEFGLGWPSLGKQVTEYDSQVYRVSSKTVCTPILLFSRVPEHIQKNFWPFFNSPGDEDFKTHLTFLPMWKIDLVTEPNVRQTGFWKYHFNGRFCFFFEGVANFRVNYLSHF